MTRILRLFFWLLLLGGACFALEARRFLRTPGSDAAQERLIVVAPGATFDQVARDLEQAGAIRDSFRFRLLARYNDAFGKVRAGEHLINTGWTPEEVLWQITQGRPVLHRLSIREGLAWWETAREVEAQGFARFEDFKAVIHDPGFLREHHIPFANAEGFLYPETYLRQKPQTLDMAQAREVAAAMVGMFWAKTRPLWEAQARAPQGLAPRAAQGEAPGRDTDPEPQQGAASGSDGGADVAQPADCDPQAVGRLVILASLVEKETAVPEERARVAGVYANRLRLNMLLQCDPTIIYGLGAGFSGAILKSQINDAANRYNTYRHGGLPPGPICSPGLEALKAAAMPEKHDFLYFVAAGAGGAHNFNKTLTEHNRDVDAYRNRNRESGQ
jgi:UPF0755 protein